MFKSIVIATLVACPVVAEGKFLQPKRGTCQTSGSDVKSITLDKNNHDIGVCVNKCLNDSDCIGMQFTEPNYCNLYYSIVEEVSHFIIPNVKTAENAPISIHVTTKTKQLIFSLYFRLLTRQMGLTVEK